MQTQCPQCHTLFRVTEEQCQIADGLVRCGVCDHTFNVFEVELPDTAQTGSREAITDHLPDTPATDADEDSTDEYGIEPLPLFTQDNLTQDSDEANDFSDESHNASSTDVTPAISGKQVADTVTAENLKSEEDELDLFQLDADTESDGQTTGSNTARPVMPEQFLREQKSSFGSTVLWSLAIIFLAITLVLEYIWFNRNELIQNPQFKPWLERTCTQFDCQLAALRAPDQIELLTRNIYSHPNRDNALIVSVTLVNHASFAQPYPVMQIDFSDIRGGAVAARRFPAEIYLQTNQEQLQLLAPEQPASFTMEIIDPGKQAMTYEFNFL